MPIPIGGLIQSFGTAVQDNERRVRMENVLKLTKKDFIKKFTSKNIFLGKVEGDEWYNPTSKFGNEKEAEKYYDTLKIIMKKREEEIETYRKDIKKLSKEAFLKKYAVYKYPTYKHKINGEDYYDIMGEGKMEIISKERADKIINPSFFRLNLGDDSPLLLEKPDRKRLGNIWDNANKKSIKKTSSSKSNNITEELKELKKLYKSGDLSKKQFEKAKDKLLK